MSTSGQTSRDAPANRRGEARLPAVIAVLVAIPLSAIEVWLTNIIVFALGYWELDRGGPVRRAHARQDELPPADFRFSQDENDDAVQEVARGSSGNSGWVPSFVDYLYVSITNST